MKLEKIKPGTLYRSKDKNYAHSLYKDLSDFERHFWSGLTPDGGALLPEDTVMLLSRVFWDNEPMYKVLHNSTIRYVCAEFLQKIPKNK